MLFNKKIQIQEQKKVMKIWNNKKLKIKFEMRNATENHILYSRHAKQKKGKELEARQNEIICNQKATQPKFRQTVHEPDLQS